MKKNKKSLTALILIIFIINIMPFNVFANTDSLGTVTVDKIPNTLEEFLALRDKISDTPQGGATMLIIALIIYAQNPDLGEKCVVISLDMNNLSKGNTYKGYSVSSSNKYYLDKVGKNSGQSYIPRSYVKGTSPENDYTIPSGKLKFEYTYNKYSGSIESGEFKVFVDCSGADTPRPIIMKKNKNGIWKAYNWSSIVVGIRKPASEEVVDDL